MIPIALEAGLLLALWIRWWAVPVVAAGWALVVVIGYPSDWLAGVALGAVNAAIGAIIGVGLRAIVVGIVEWVRLQADPHHRP